MFTHQHNEPTFPAGIPDDDYDRHDAALGYLGNGLWWQAADLVREFDEFPKARLQIHPLEQPAAERALAEKGLGLADLGGHYIVHALTTCPGCWESKPIDLPCSGCAAMAGATPLDEVEEETGQMCAICFKSSAGPPFPFCCSGRARLIKKITGPGPFKACSVCHGKGAEVGCTVCEGTGVAL